MRHDLANVALKRTAEDREGWRHRERMSECCHTEEDYCWWHTSLDVSSWELL